jgi:hypothetical protein
MARDPREKVRERGEVEGRAALKTPGWRTARAAEPGVAESGRFVVLGSGDGRHGISRRNLFGKTRTG